LCLFLESVEKYHDIAIIEDEKHTVYVTFVLSAQFKDAVFDMLDELSWQSVLCFQ